MEIEIDSKINNPLFNRTEVHFTIQHEGEKTPNREIIRSELAEKLNAKKEDIIINDIQSSSGIQRSIGYAKIYSSMKKAGEMERKHILKRNKISGKKEKKEGEKTENREKPPKEEEKPAEEKE
jgi:small subunit ribosomal protein S24e